MPPRAPASLQLVRRRQGLVRWLAAWVSLLVRARQAQRALARRERVEHLRRIVIRGALTRRSPAQITMELARAMYEFEVRHGAGDTDVGLYGPRLFRREARALLVEILGEL